MRRPARSTTVATSQSDLFGDADLLPDGLAFEPEFIDRAEEAELLAIAGGVALRAARYRGYTARRRVFAYGARFDFEEGSLRPGDIDALPLPLQRLRQRVAGWLGVATHEFVHVMVSEYSAGTPLGWHRDAPGYELIAGVSLGGSAQMRFRRWSAGADGEAPEPSTKTDETLALELAPRSVYVMRGVARWGWQHSVAPVPALRYSITLRTARHR